MRTLVIPDAVFEKIVRTVSEGPRGCETGVTLFGARSAGRSDACHVVLAIAGPGRRATHEPAHYSADEHHANEIYAALRSALPGIGWIGEFHVHPLGMTWLSHGDRQTIRQILTGTDATLHPDEFIAGVMQRRNGTVDIYPFHFTRERLRGDAMELRIVDAGAIEVYLARLNAAEERETHDRHRPGIRTEPDRSGTAVPKARGFRRLREWWQRHRPHGRARGSRPVHAG